MKRTQVLQDITTRFKQEVLNVFDKSKKRVYIDIRPESIVPVARYIFEDLGARFNIASGMDTRQFIEILYHFTFEDLNLLVSLRVKLNRAKPSIASLTSVCEAVNWIEREMHELLGIDFKGHPELKRLLLPDSWPKGVYPLRTDYKEWDKTAIRDRGVK
jgi:NADH:ubiquinone oxidoreductase subunit C